MYCVSQSNATLHKHCGCKRSIIEGRTGLRALVHWRTIRGNRSVHLTPEQVLNGAIPANSGKDRVIRFYGGSWEWMRARSHHFTAGGMDKWSFYLNGAVEGRRMSHPYAGMDGWINGWMYGWINGCMGGLMDERMDGLMDAWING